MSVDSHLLHKESQEQRFSTGHTRDVPKISNSASRDKLASCNRSWGCQKMPAIGPGLED
jgi:hypothetical protein